MKWAMRVLQGFSIALAILIIAVFVLAVFQRVSWGVFFVLAAVLGIIAYAVIPRVRTILERK
jgi:hypothetical protein